MKTKVCKRCKEEKPIEMFSKLTKSPDGLYSYCKDCKSKMDKDYRIRNDLRVKEKQRKYREENKSKIKERLKKWYKENKAEINQQHQQYYHLNKDYIKGRVKTYRENNKEAVSQYRKQYYKNNKELINQYQKQWYEINKENVLDKVKSYREINGEKIKSRKKQYNKQNPGNGNNRAQRYRTRKMQLMATLTNAQWKQILNDFEYKCAYCGKREDEQFGKYKEPLHREHFIPLSKGGEYTHKNIIPACKGCNASKNNNDFSEWYPKQNFYSVQRENRILKYLNYKEE